METVTRFDDFEGGGIGMDVKKCKECEHFRYLYPPMGQYDAGRVACKKYDLVKDYISKQSLNRLTCVEEMEGES